MKPGLVSAFYADPAMLNKARKSTSAVRGSAAARVTANMEVQRNESLFRISALQTAILTSPNFSIIATDEKGIIQLFNVGAERMLGQTHRGQRVHGCIGRCPGILDGTSGKWD